MAGMRGVNPRQMNQMMKKMGITNTDLKGVTEVIIRMKDEEIVIRNPQVTRVDMQGSRNYQIAGPEETRPLGSAGDAPAGPSFPEEDIELVMSQTNCERDVAVKALEECDGQPAEAIVKIISG